MLELRNIVKEYPTGSSTLTALKGVSIAFRESEFVAILGQSGCGKTTLLNIVGGLDKYTDGDLIITLSDGRVLNAGHAVGEDGVTFIPSINEQKILSWTNDGSLENPEPVDLNPFDEWSDISNTNTDFSLTLLTTSLKGYPIFPPKITSTLCNFNKLYKENPENYKGSIADFSMVLRVALTTKQNTPDLYELLKNLGKERIEKRFARI